MPLLKDESMHCDEITKFVKYRKYALIVPLRDP